MISKNILITGGEGALGSYFKNGTRLGRDTLDVTDLSAVLRICAEYKPEVIIHCAALTDLALCEKEPEKAYLINAVGTYQMALGARNVGARFVYISTSDVFDGTKGAPYTPEDVPNPGTVYGRSKHLGELAVEGLLNNYLIVRISWVFGGGPARDNKFVGKLLLKKDATEFRAVTDRKGAPTWGKEVANAVMELIKQNASGIYHIGGGPATRYEMAQEVIKITKSSTKVLEAVSAEFPSPYKVGEDESMPLSPLVRPWRESLKEYIETEWKN